MKTNETQKIEKFTDKLEKFLQENKPEIKGDAMFFDYDKLEKEVQKELEQNPEEVLELIETALDEMYKECKNKRLRLTNIPDKLKKKVEELRAKDINKLVCVEGKIIQTSEVRPQCVNAKFECPSCGKIMEILQLEKKFREPKESCKCGRKGNFRLVSKEMVDARRLVIADIEGIWMRKINDDGKWLKDESQWDKEETECRLSVFLQEDLVDYNKEPIYAPGNKIKVFGILKEIPISLDTGGISVRFDLAIEAWNVWSEENKSSFGAK